jgi:hypothetical protein
LLLQHTASAAAPRSAAALLLEQAAAPMLPLQHHMLGTCPPEDVVASVTSQCDQFEDVLGCHRGNLQQMQGSMPAM